MSINCKRSTGELAEYVAAMFSALVLFTLCEPRLGDRPGADRKANAKKVRRSGAIHPSKYSFMKAAGYADDTPSNSYLWLTNAPEEREAHFFPSHRNVQPTSFKRANYNKYDIPDECPWERWPLAKFKRKSIAQGTMGPPCGGCLAAWAPASGIEARRGGGGFGGGGGHVGGGGGGCDGGGGGGGGC